jgi:antitoxin HigA-1
MTKKERSELGRLLSSLRKNTKNAGRKKRLRRCEECGAELGAREMRAHKCTVSSITRTSAAPELPPLIAPGEYLATEFLEPLALSADALASALRVPAAHIQGIVERRCAITADTALRLAQYFGTTPEFWIQLQGTYELDQAKRDRLAQIQAEVPRHIAAEEGR